MWIRGLLTCLLLLVLAACATRPPTSDPDALALYKEINDPLEPTNRAMLKFNQGFEKILLRPVAKGYRAIIPAPARKGVGNALHNLRSPVIFTNDLLQGEGGRAGETLGRFLINSTLGIAGLFDVAKKFGLESHDEDFGQTLAVWGSGEGPYLMLPIFGPSNIRDGFGLGIDIITDPLFWILRGTDEEYLLYVRTGVEGLDRYVRNQNEIEELERSSLDYYAAVRSAYRQNRESEIRNGAEEELGVPDFLLDDETDPFDELSEDPDPTKNLDPDGQNDDANEGGVK